MSNTLVAYYSRTGNTQKIAETIFAALEGKKTIKAVEDIKEEDLSEFSLIFMGFPVYSHSIPVAVEGFLKSIPAGKKVAFFSTHGSLTGGRLSREAIEYATVLASQAKVLGTYTCRGKVSPQALENLMKSPEHKAWAEMAASANTHPDTSDLEDAHSFANWIMTLATQD